MQQLRYTNSIKSQSLIKLPTYTYVTLVLRGDTIDSSINPSTTHTMMRYLHVKCITYTSQLFNHANVHCTMCTHKGNFVFTIITLSSTAYTHFLSFLSLTQKARVQHFINDTPFAVVLNVHLMRMPHAICSINDNIIDIINEQWTQTIIIIINT